MEAWASLRALEVGDMRWQPVPVTDGHGGQKNLYASFVAGSWRKHLDPLVRWSFMVGSESLCRAKLPTCRVNFLFFQKILRGDIS